MRHNAKKGEVYSVPEISTLNDGPDMNRVYTLRGDGKSVRQMYESDKND